MEWSEMECITCKTWNGIKWNGIGENMEWNEMERNGMDSIPLHPMFYTMPKK